MASKVGFVKPAFGIISRETVHSLAHILFVPVLIVFVPVLIELQPSTTAPIRPTTNAKRKHGATRTTYQGPWASSEATWSCNTGISGWGAPCVFHSRATELCKDLQDGVLGFNLFAEADHPAFKLGAVHQGLHFLLQYRQARVGAHIAPPACRQNTAN
ncbi:hypothetical protein FN846DRAFT_887133 [Sphaerosporella brunnea]|uniref:Uncharacterized protein n=1 Tax=Sphaerosporella brunnea TaxID=1250544 RepID=A0A5J5F6I4_9PEZI|nr:hypothetical protein FN846DRAFT_887133 [Sphaerosporella brunnea]